MTELLFDEDGLSRYLCGDGIERNLHIWQAEQSRAILLCIHGGLSHGGDYQTVGQYFREKKITCIAPDLTGHADSKKVTLTCFDQFLDDVENCYQWIQAQYPQTPVFIIGHSMGGLIASYSGLTRFKDNTAIKGYILSSPYYHNKIEVPAILQKLSGLASKILPKLTVPMEDFTEQLTHDKAIQQRIYKDLEQDLRAHKASARLAHELLTAQKNLPNLMRAWDKDLLIFTAGKDELSDNQATQQILQSITDNSCHESHHFPENFHENFNENNRLEIFELMLKWIKTRI